MLNPKIYFIKDVEQIIRKNRLTLRRWWNKEQFPKPSYINGRLAWHSEVIEQWISQNVKGVQHEKASNTK
tara:strand:+ start:9812 stop:10021 length:210 start_codon:yes stop_codon:yes gene_type:complete